MHPYSLQWYRVIAGGRRTGLSRASQFHHSSFFNLAASMVLSPDTRLHYPPATPPHLHEDKNTVLQNKIVLLFVTVFFVFLNNLLHGMSFNNLHIL